MQCTVTTFPVKKQTSKARRLCWFADVYKRQMLKVGYGAMVLESLLAVIALCVAGASAANGTASSSHSTSSSHAGSGESLSLIHI